VCVVAVRLLTARDLREELSLAQFQSMKGLSQLERVNHRLYRDYEEPKKAARPRPDDVATPASGATTAPAAPAGTASASASATTATGSAKADKRDHSFYYRVTVEVRALRERHTQVSPLRTGLCSCAQDNGCGMPHDQVALMMGRGTCTPPPLRSDHYTQTANSHCAVGPSHAAHRHRAVRVGMTLIVWAVGQCLPAPSTACASNAAALASVPRW
jgi:hypothetical protein